MRGRQEASQEAGEPEVGQAVLALQAGASVEAFEVIFKAYFRPLFHFFDNQSALREDAEDLAQETLSRALEKIDTYDFRAPFGGWLRRIAENVWKNALRARLTQRRGGFHESLDAQDESVDWAPTDRPLFGLPSPSPEQNALDAELGRELDAAIASLPAGMRRVAELRLGLDLKYEEIAAVTKIDLGTVRSQLSEARRRLKPLLRRYFADAEL